MVEPTKASKEEKKGKDKDKKEKQKQRQSLVPEDQLSLLPDPLGDRVMKDVHTLCNRPIADEDLWGKKNVPNWKLLEEHLAREGPVTKK